MNKEEASTSYDNYCNILVADKDEVKKLCKKIARNLINLKYVKLMKNETHGDHCFYFNFWTYEEISKIYYKKCIYNYNILGSTKIFDINRNINNELGKAERDNIFN